MLVARVISTVTASPEISTLSLHDALPIFQVRVTPTKRSTRLRKTITLGSCDVAPCHQVRYRSEEHTSELQSHSDLVCRLLLEKKKGELEYLTPRALLRDVSNPFMDAASGI